MKKTRVLRVAIVEPILNLTKNSNDTIVLSLLNHYIESNNSNYVIINYFQKEYSSILNFSVKTISRILEKLNKQGLITIENLDAVYIRNEIIKNKEPYFKGNGIGNKSCLWCGCKTMILHEHHFPIPKSKGGIETVGICPNCHNEFHSMEVRFFINEQVKKIFDKIETVYYEEINVVGDFI